MFPDLLDFLQPIRHFNRLTLALHGTHHHSYKENIVIEKSCSYLQVGSEIPQEL